MTHTVYGTDNARCRPRGQALVEAALVMPVLLFAFLVMAELAFIVSASHGWQRGADVLAQSAAVRVSQDPDWRPGWNVVAAEEQDRAGCGQPVVTFPEGTQAGGRVEVRWSCQYEALLINGFSLQPANVVSVAVIPQSNEPPPSPVP